MEQDGKYWSRYMSINQEFNEENDFICELMRKAYEEMLKTFQYFIDYIYS